MRSEPIYLTVILAISSPQEIRRILESCYARHFRRHFRAGYDGAHLLEGAPAEGADR